MYSFVNDYSEGVHPRILKAMVEANLVQTSGYGEDEYTMYAAKLLKKKLNDDKVDIHLMVGGTQTNKVCLSAFLKPHEAVIATHEGHIFTHEAGAIEATGHKVLAIESPSGKLDVQLVDKVVKNHPDYHMVKPKIVYISNSSELGTNYSLEELVALRKYCDANNLYLYMDGARFASALMAPNNDVKMEHLTRLFDAFYLGATKNGGLFGEAVVIVNDGLKEDFKYIMKQNGALLAKSKFLGIQFIELFQNDLFEKLADHANKLALQIKEAFIDAGYAMFIESNTNQQFPIIANELLPKLDSKYQTSVWCAYGDKHTVIRFVTSWATPSSEVAKLVKDIHELNS